MPCHRIVGADGALTGYAGGLERKRALLALERAAADPRRRACVHRAHAARGMSPMRGADLARLVALAVLWSASFVFIRVVVAPLGPVWTATLRMLVAGVALVALFALVGYRADVRASLEATWSSARSTRPRRSCSSRGRRRRCRRRTS